MKTIFSKDLINKKIFVTREFSAPIELTWKAWTDKKILDEWWAPKPWKAETKEMDLKEGGRWLYCMVGPEGERHWCRCDFTEIVQLKYYKGTDFFCDENGNKISQPSPMDWKVEFHKTQTGTKVLVEVSFATEKDLQTIVEMGFEEGFNSAHNNLDELFAKAEQTV